MIVFARHGETPPNRERLLLGRADPPLTDRGRQQADELAHRLGARGPTKVVTSPLRRARDTASPIAAASGVPVEIDERLIEIDYGEWEGLPFARLDADIVARWHHDPELVPPGGESLVTVAARMAAFCEEMLADETTGAVVAVSHVSPIKAAVTWALGVSPELAWRMRLDVASLTRIGRGPVVLSFNETL